MNYLVAMTKVLYARKEYVLFNKFHSEFFLTKMENLKQNEIFSEKDNQRNELSERKHSLFSINSMSIRISGLMNRISTKEKKEV